MQEIINSFFQQLGVDKEVLLSYSVRILLVLLILYLSRLLHRFNKNLVLSLHAKKAIPPSMARTLIRVSRYTLIIVAALLVLQQLGMSITSFWAFISAVVAMIAVGFVAVWSIVSNVFSAVLLLGTRPFRIGDRIELVDAGTPEKGIKGTVINIGLIFIELKERQQHIIIPNNMVFQKFVRVTPGKKTFELRDQIFTEPSLLDPPADSGQEKTKP